MQKEFIPYEQALALKELKNQKRNREPHKIRVDKEKWFPY
jgi:hypothetical protein